MADISSSHVFACQSIAKSYSGRRVLHQVSIEIHTGEAVAILGPNGAGKTTCFSILIGLVQPDHGIVLLDGHNITDLAMHRRAGLGIGYLPQEMSVFRGLNVENNIRAVLQLGKLDKRTIETRLHDLLQEFKIEHLRKQPVGALSGGERRRLEIARALATNPAFILFDEPLAGIDPVTVKDIRDTVHALTARNIGVLITDHNVAETLKIVSRAYIIHAGEVIAKGTPSQIRAHELARKYYLGDSFADNNLADGNLADGNLADGSRA
ncbi:MAG: LPS export ABC transporter ATP-binding protein [Pseudomonadota bacterium]